MTHFVTLIRAGNDIDGRGVCLVDDDLRRRERNRRDLLAALDIGRESGIMHLWKPGPPVMSFKEDAVRREHYRGVPERPLFRRMAQSGA